MKTPGNKRGPVCTCRLTLGHETTCPRGIWWQARIASNRLEEKQG